MNDWIDREASRVGELAEDSLIELMEKVKSFLQNEFGYDKGSIYYQRFFLSFEEDEDEG